jgi:hypothetical protein
LAGVFSIKEQALYLYGYLLTIKYMLYIIKFKLILKSNAEDMTVDTNVQREDAAAVSIFTLRLLLPPLNCQAEL